MTKQELIDHLKHLEQYTHYSEDAPALREAISMLKCSEMPNGSEERTQKRTGTHACDCISRQAAIDALHMHLMYRMGTDSNKKRLDEWINNLPSAQPDSKELSFTQKKLDTISRQAAIRWVKTECNPYGKPTLDFESGKKVIEHLKQMPSAQSERQKGEWIDCTEDGYVECPFCHSATNCDGNKDELHFCFSCGADMRGK